MITLKGIERNEIFIKEKRFLNTKCKGKTDLRPPPHTHTIESKEKEKQAL